jgi:hypothetical protein
MWWRISLAAAVLAVAFAPRAAKADEATVAVGESIRDDDARFARPPAHAVAVDDVVPPPANPAPEPYRAPVRLTVGPVGVTTGNDLGLGLGVSADFGTGTVGVRLGAAWVRGEGSTESPSGAPLGSSLGQYTGELTVDLHKRGPLHPVFGLGFGLVHIDGPLGSGSAGVGTARFGVEYALTVEDADVRLGAGVTGVLPGPADRELGDLRGYALVGAGVSIGF